MFYAHRCPSSHATFSTKYSVEIGNVQRNFPRRQATTQPRTLSVTAAKSKRKSISVYLRESCVEHELWNGKTTHSLVRASRFYLKMRDNCPDVELPYSVKISAVRRKRTGPSNCLPPISAMYSTVQVRAVSNEEWYRIQISIHSQWCYQENSSSGRMLPNTSTKTRTNLRYRSWPLKKICFNRTSYPSAMTRWFHYKLPRTIKVRVGDTYVTIAG